MTDATGTSEGTGTIDGSGQTDTGGTERHGGELAASVAPRYGVNTKFTRSGAHGFPQR